ncbi:MAG: ABC transporter substrate-binding protein [Chloroflexi bacterium]|nr:ABC transporter substrate-binding protein [Chloroflexota bacterium]
MDEPISRERADLIVRQFHRYEQYFARQGVGRRQFLRMIALGSAAATVLPVLEACGLTTPAEVRQATAQPVATSAPVAQPAATAAPAAQPTAAAGTQAGAPQRGGRIIIGTLGEAQSINPLLSNETEGQWRDKLLFDEFVRIDLESLKPVPGIASDWSVSSDGATYTFTLRDGVKFSDGQPLTASDVLFTLQGILTKSVASVHAPRFLPIQGAQAYFDGEASTISGAQVVDDRTLKITLAQPNAAFVSSLRWLRPLPKHLLDGKDLSNDPFFQAPIGAGPFIFKSWTNGQDYVAERNPNYWDPNKPYLDGFIHRVIPDSQTLVLALQTGQIDGSEYALPTQADQLKAAGNMTVIVKPQGVDTNGWSFGQKSNAALKDPRVRRAIAMALDTQRFSTDFLLGLGQPAKSPIPPGSWAYNQSLQPIPFDPAQAKALLQDAGATGLTLRLTTNAGNHFREDWVTFTQQGLSDIGVNVQPDVKEWTQVVKDGTDGTFDLICPTFAGVLVDPDELYLPLYSTSSRNVMGYSNPEMDTLLDQGRQTVDLDARKQIYAQVQQLIQQDVPAFYAWDRPFVSVTASRFTGYKNTILSFFNDLQDWSLA